MRWFRKISPKSILVAAILSLPLALPLAGVALNSINPMMLIFLYRFEVANQSGATIWITPIGAVGGAGNRYVLPQFVGEALAFPSIRQGQFRLATGESLEIVYDWDDINFSELLVRDAGGEYRALVVDAAPTLYQYRPPSSDVFVIPELSTLPHAPRAVVEAAGNAYDWLVVKWLAPGLFPVVLLLAWGLLRIRRVSRSRAVV